jgi:hypothetical protein
MLDRRNISAAPEKGVPCLTPPAFGIKVAVVTVPSTTAPKSMQATPVLERSSSKSSSQEPQSGVQVQLPLIKLVALAQREHSGLSVTTSLTLIN